MNLAQTRLNRAAWIFAAVLLILLGAACAPSAPSAAVAAPQTQARFSPLRVAAPDCSYGGSIQVIEALDEHTVHFRLCSPEPAFLQKIAVPVFSILDSEYIDDKIGSSELISLKPSGTGPYRLVERVRGRSVRLEKNPTYWGIPPRLDTITLTWQPTGADRVRALTGHSVDLADQPDTADYKTVESDKDLRLVERQPLNLVYIGMKSNVRPFNDADVRRALALAIDRQNIVLQYFPPGSQVAEQVVPPSVQPGYTRDVLWYDYLPVQSQTLLTVLKFDLNTSLTLTYSSEPMTYLSNPEEVARKIQQDLAVVGVKVELQPMPLKEFKQAVNSGEAAFYLDELTAEYADASAFYNPLFLDPVRFLGDPDGDLQAAVRNASNNPDSLARQSYYDQANQLLYRKVSIIPIGHAASAMVFRNVVENVLPGPMNENFTEISTISDTLAFAQTGEPLSLWPGDEEDLNSWRVGQLLYDTLVRYDYGSTRIVPSLAESWESNATMTDWTFYLRYDVTFHDGRTLDANDVVASFAAMWNASDPYHLGRSGKFAIFKRFFGNFVNIK